MSAAKARLDCSTTPAPSSVTTPPGMVSTMVSKFAAPLLDGLVGGGELRRRALSELAAGLEVGGHVIEGACTRSPISPVARHGNAMVVFAGGDLVHGVGQRFDGAGDLLGQKQGQPDAGEEDKDRDQAAA